MINHITGSYIFRMNLNGKECSGRIYVIKSFDKLGCYKNRKG